MSNIRSILKPEGSVMASIAVAGSVVALYSAEMGPVANVRESDANHPSHDSSRKKAGYTAFLLVSALGLITRDGNILILGYGTIAAMEIHYRSAIMTDPKSGTMVGPTPSDYQEAGNGPGLSAVAS